MCDVLIVDDDGGFVQTCALMLRRDGYTAYTADSAHAAIARLGNGQPSAMLLDWKLPDGTALDVLQWVAKRDRSVPTALVTGCWIDPEFENAQAEARRLGVRECIRRGLDFDEPTDIVRRLLDPLSRLHDALLSGDIAARDALVGELIYRIQPRLLFRFGRYADGHMIAAVVLDAVAQYLGQPSRFQPQRHLSVEHFTYTLARRILWNALRSERRRHIREDEYARLRCVSMEPEISEEFYDRTLIEEALSKECDLDARAAIRAWLDGERGTGPWLSVPALRALTVAERRAAVERRKDAFRVRVKRLANRRRRTNKFS